MAERQTASPLTADIELTSKDVNDSNPVKDNTPVSAIEGYSPIHATFYCDNTFESKYFCLATFIKGNYIYICFARDDLDPT